MKARTVHATATCFLTELLFHTPAHRGDMKFTLTALHVTDAKSLSDCLVVENTDWEESHNEYSSRTTSPSTFSDSLGSNRPCDRPLRWPNMMWNCRIASECGAVFQLSNSEKRRTASKVMTSARKQRPVKNTDFQTAYRSDCTVLVGSCTHVFAVDVSRGQPFYWRSTPRWWLQ